MNFVCFMWISEQKANFVLYNFKIVVFILVEIKWINFRRNTTVFSICWRKQLHVSALFWVGHNHVETKTSGKTHILKCGYQAWGTRSRFTMFGEECSYIYIHICDVDFAMFTTLFVASSVSSSTRGLESSLNVALESVGRSVLDWVGFINDWGFFFRCASWVVIQIMPRSKRL
jgi:hypothetical protein